MNSSTNAVILGTDNLILLLYFYTRKNIALLWFLKTIQFIPDFYLKYEIFYDGSLTKANQSQNKSKQKKIVIVIIINSNNNNNNRNSNYH